ncbi:MAG: acyltransferase, partial [Deltaproteobacteria bacterium]|nr:acyltransferase [Deltaproteobacteria bacterium]
EIVFRRLRSWKLNATYFDFGFAISVAALLAGALGHLRFLPHLEMASVLVGFPLLIVCTSQGQLFKRVLRLRPLRYLGDISYSIYLIHFPVQLALHLCVAAGWVKIDYESPAILMLFLALTVVLASGTYHLLELPWQRAINDLWRNHRKRTT